MAGMTAPLHMMKLCVGAANPEALERWQRDRFGDAPNILFRTRIDIRVSFRLA